MNSESKRPIQIEDLLRLKRAERPPAEFWSEFDRQLRAKQLAAIVEKRPWWQRLPKLWRGLPRYTVPVGAATVLMVAYLSLRDERPVPGASVAVAPQVTNARAVVVEPVAATTANDVTENSVVPNATHEAVAATGATENGSGVRAVASHGAAPEEISRVIPLLGALGAEPPKAAPTLAASTLPPMRASSNAVLTAGLLRAVSESRATARQAVEPLQQITPPSERLRARLLTAMVSVPSNESPARETGTRAANQISEENLYDTSHRFGARGAGVMMKF